MPCFLNSASIHLNIRLMWACCIHYTPLSSTMPPFLGDVLYTDERRPRDYKQVMKWNKWLLWHYSSSSLKFCISFLWKKGIPPIFKKKHFFQLFWAIVKRNLNSRTTTCKEMRAWDNLTKWNGSTRFTIYFPTLYSNHCTLPIPIQQTFSYAKIIWNFFDSCVFMQNINKTIFFILQTIMCSACWWGRYER